MPKATAQIRLTTSTKCLEVWKLDPDVLTQKGNTLQSSNGSQVFRSSPWLTLLWSNDHADVPPALVTCPGCTPGCCSPGVCARGRSCLICFIAGCVELGVPLMIGAKCAKTTPGRKSEKPCARDPQFITFSSHWICDSFCCQGVVWNFHREAKSWLRSCIWNKYYSTSSM